jgi:hypothetical protein
MGLTSTGQSRHSGGRATGHRRLCFRLPHARCARHDSLGKPQKAPLNRHRLLLGMRARMRERRRLDVLAHGFVIVAVVRPDRAAMEAA